LKLGIYIVQPFLLLGEVVDIDKVLRGWKLVVLGFVSLWVLDIGVVDEVDLMFLGGGCLG